MKGHVGEGLGFWEDGNAFAVIAAGAGFNNDLIAWKLVEGGDIEGLGIAQGEGRCGDVVLLKELFLDAFVLDGLEHRGFGDDGFAFFFKLHEGVNVDVFDFPGDNI